MIRRPPRSTQSRSSAASDVYKRQMKNHPGDIRIDDYRYDLPQERIARYPLPERDESKLLLWDGKSISDRVFKELPAILNRDDLLVFNNTRVIRARLLFTKESGAAIEIFC